MIGWKITRDHVPDRDDIGRFRSQVGRTSQGWNEGLMPLCIPFKLRDDDGHVYYRGFLVDDEYCDSQDDVLEWGMRFAGCTKIEVKRKGRWVQDIG